MLDGLIKIYWLFSKYVRSVINTSTIYTADTTIRYINMLSFLFPFALLKFSKKLLNRYHTKCALFYG